MGFFGLSKPKNKEKDNMVLLATAHGNVEMSVLQSILEGEGIPYMANDRGSGGVVRIIAGYSMYGTDIYVSKDVYERAAELLDAYRNGEEVVDEDALPAEDDETEA